MTCLTRWLKLCGTWNNARIFFSFFPFSFNLGHKWIMQDQQLGKTTMWEMSEQQTWSIFIFSVSVFTKDILTSIFIALYLKTNILKYGDSMVQNRCITLHQLFWNVWKILEISFRIHTKYCVLCSADI